MCVSVKFCFRFALALPALVLAWHLKNTYHLRQLDKWAADVYSTTKVPTYFPDTYAEDTPNGSYKEFYNSLYTDGEAYAPTNDHSLQGHYHDHRALDYGHEGAIISALNRNRDKGNATITNVVEFGCSHGWGIAQLVGHGYKVWGMDVAEKAIQLATVIRGRTCGEGDKPCFWQASVTNLPFKDGQFDAGISSDVLEHIMPKDVPRAVSEMSRVVKNHMVHQIAAMGDYPTHPSAIHAFTPDGNITVEWWRNQFSSAGWDIVHESWGGSYCNLGVLRTFGSMLVFWYNSGVLGWPKEWYAIPLPIETFPFSLEDLCRQDLIFEMVRAL